MEPGTLEQKIAKLPQDFKLKAEGYIDALLDELSQIKKESTDSPQPRFGSGKGFFGEIRDDFDEPLDDMKEYM